MTKFKIFIYSPEKSGAVKFMKDEYNSSLVISPEKCVSYYNMIQNIYNSDSNDYIDNIVYKIDSKDHKLFSPNEDDKELLSKIDSGSMDSDPYAIIWIKYILTMLEESVKYNQSINVIYPETFLHPDWIGFLVRNLMYFSMCNRKSIYMVTNSAHVMEHVYNEMKLYDAKLFKEYKFDIEQYINEELLVTDYTKNL